MRSGASSGHLQATYTVVAQSSYFLRQSQLPPALAARSLGRTGRFFVGLGSASGNVVSFAVISDVFCLHERGKMLGLVTGSLINGVSGLLLNCVFLLTTGTEVSSCRIARGFHRPVRRVAVDSYLAFNHDNCLLGADSDCAARNSLCARSTSPRVYR